jgi:flagellar assembly protein FliH
MAQTEKFLFDTTFDAEAQQAAEAMKHAAPPPGYSSADLAEARDEGFADGRSAGLEEAAQSTEHATAQALLTIASRLEEMIEQLAKTSEEREHQAIETAIMLLRKLFPELSRRNALTEVLASIGRCLEQLRDEPRVVVRIADALLDPLHERLESLATKSAFDGKIVLLADESVSSGDVRVEWADGGVERDTVRLWAEIDQVLERAAGRPLCAGPAQTEAAPAAMTCPTAGALPTAGAEDEPAEPA